MLERRNISDHAVPFFPITQQPVFTLHSQHHSTATFTSLIDLFIKQPLSNYSKMNVTRELCLTCTVTVEVNSDQDDRNHVVQQLASPCQEEIHSKK